MTTEPDPTVPQPATPIPAEARHGAIDDDALRAALIAARADARDQRYRADRAERDARLLYDVINRQSPDETLGWGWRTGAALADLGPVPSREEAIAAAVKDLEACYRELTQVPSGTKSTELILVGRCLPWQPQALDPAGVLGAMHEEASRTSPSLFAQIAPFEWTIVQREALGRRLRTALRDWLDEMDRAPFWVLEPRLERVQVEITVPERLPAQRAVQVAAAVEMPAADGSRS